MLALWSCKSRFLLVIFRSIFIINQCFFASAAILYQSIFIAATTLIEHKLDDFFRIKAYFAYLGAK